MGAGVHPVTQYSHGNSSMIWKLPKMVILYCNYVSCCRSNCILLLLSLSVWSWVFQSIGPENVFSSRSYLVIIGKQGHRWLPPLVFVRGLWKLKRRIDWLSSSTVMLVLLANFWQSIRTAILQELAGWPEESSIHSVYILERHSCNQMKTWKSNKCKYLQRSLEEHV